MLRFLLSFASQKVAPAYSPDSLSGLLNSLWPQLILGNRDRAPHCASETSSIVHVFTLSGSEGQVASHWGDKGSEVVKVELGSHS